MRDDREKLLDILEAIERIEKYSKKGEKAFLNDELVQVWTMYHIQVIGEAASNLSSAIYEQHPDIPWVDIVAMRNVLVHQYFGIDLQQVWDTVVIDLPRLKDDISSILKK